MNSMDQKPDDEPIEKKYSYRPGAFSTYGAMVAGLIYTAIVIWWFIRDGEVVSLLALAGSLFIFLGGIYMAVWRIQNKRNVTISKEGVYLPFDPPFVPFSEITGVLLRGDEVDRIFCITVASKSYEIHSTLLPSAKDFQEIVATIQAHMPSHVKRVSQ